MDYLTQEQIESLVASLEEQQNRLARLAKSTVEQQLASDGNQMPDTLDISLNESMQSTEHRLRDREQYLLGKIKDALQRIESGDYGYCKECDDEIGFPRLNARPVAELCIECKEDKERRDSQHRDRRDAEASA